MRPVPPFFSSLSVVQVTQSRAVLSPSQGDESEKSASGERRRRQFTGIREARRDCVVCAAPKRSKRRTSSASARHTNDRRRRLHSTCLPIGWNHSWMCSRKMGQIPCVCISSKLSNPQLIGPDITTTPGMPLNEPGRSDRWKEHPGRRRTGNGRTAGWPS